MLLFVVGLVAIDQLAIFESVAKIHRLAVHGAALLTDVSCLESAISLGAFSPRATGVGAIVSRHHANTLAETVSGFCARAS